MSNIQNIVKNIQDIMRKDAGVDGDAQRISQIVWLLFLKFLDDQDRNNELVYKNYKSSIPEKFQWRNWAADPGGMTGETLLDFVDNKLIPTFKNLSYGADDGRGEIVKQVFQDTYNYMKSGTLLRQVVNKINEIDLNKSLDRHAFNDIYEKLLKDLQSAGNAGEYYTPRPVTNFVVELVDPKLGEDILDPACGTGGFLISAFDYIKGDQDQIKIAKQLIQLGDQLHGVEKKSLPYLLCITNLILHGIDDPHQIRRDNLLLKPLINYGPADRVDVILTNPPFGGQEEDGVQLNFPQQFRTRETADLFLLLIIQLLKPGGRAGIVLPDGSLFGEGVKSKIKEHLLTECNLHTIVRLPSGVFNPYAGVNTNLLFFTKGEPTKEVWYYQMQLPAGLRAYTKMKPITDREFEVVKEWWNDRKENDCAWKVSIEDIKARNWNLDFKNPKGGEVEEEIGSKELVDRILGKEEEIKDLIKNL